MSWRIYETEVDPVRFDAPAPPVVITVFNEISIPIFRKRQTYNQQFKFEPVLNFATGTGTTWFAGLSEPGFEKWIIYPEDAFALEALAPVVTPDSWFEHFSDPVWAKPGLRKDLQRACIDCIFRVPLTILLTLNATEDKDLAAIAIDVNAEPPPPPAGSASVVIIEIPLYNREGGASIIEEP